MPLVSFLCSTLPSLQALKRVADRMVTLGKDGCKRDFIKCRGYLNDPAMVHKVFLEFADRYKDRPGGYTRVIKTRRRLGDNAPMAYIEMVDREGELRKPRPVWQGMQDEQKKWGVLAHGEPNGFYVPIFPKGINTLYEVSIAGRKYSFFVLFVTIMVMGITIDRK